MAKDKALALATEAPDTNTGGLAILGGMGSTAVANTGYENAEVTGFENQTREDIATPFLRLLQPGSPAVVDEVAGARQGYYFNSVTMESYPEMLFVASITEHKFVEWVPRKDENGKDIKSDDGGNGFVGVYDSTDAIVAQAKENSTEFGVYRHPESGNDLVETFYVHGMAINPANGDSFAATMPFSSTHIKPYRSWQTMADYQSFVNSKGQKQRFPLFAHVFKLGSLKKEKGNNKWFVPTISWFKGDAPASRLPTDNPLYLEAESIAKGVKSGAKKTDYAQADSPKAAGAPKGDDDIPF